MVTIEIVQAIIAIEPTTYYSIMLQGMADNLTELLVRMAVLRLFIGNGYA